MKNILHIQKLSVGTEGIADLAAWQLNPRAQTSDGHPRHITRMWPKRASEILGGGSIYWVVKGEILCRQKILRFDEVIGGDSIRRCAIVLSPELVHVTPTLKRPFQGWRYLKDTDAPSDLTQAKSGEVALPSDLSAALAEIGVF